MEEKEKLEILEDMMELEAGSLQRDMKLDSIEEWDSVAAISLMALAAEQFGKRLTGAKMKTFTTVGDILEAL